MSQYIFALILTPLLFSITLVFSSVRVRNLSTYLLVGFLSFCSISLFSEPKAIELNFSHIVHYFFILADFILLFYFIYQGYKNKSKLVSGFAIIQLILFSLFLSLEAKIDSFDIVVDQVSSIMLLIVNIIGGIIVIYSLKYIESEDIKDCKKNLFISILFFFIAVMNLLVISNNIEVFFLAFELTTLCSYLLIKYRGDKIAIENSLRALWMNQIGGVAILFSLILSSIYLDTIYFDILIKESPSIFLLPISFLIIASFVKGASIPFNSWLLGAMVAPTPVSAILHSATMVKIAPYLVLKLSPALSPTLSLLVIFFGSFVFMAASFLALSRDFFKEILGYSTIGLLALMMAVAAFGTQEAITIALILMVFHAISKALLFLQAGVLEKVYHLKYLKDIDGLISYSKLTVFFILIGFASLTLPPFGAFIGKFATIEMFASSLQQNIFLVIPLIFILIGSVILTLLYFKVLTKMLSDVVVDEKPSIPLTYKITSFLLVIFLFIGIVISYLKGFMGDIEIIIAGVVLIVTFAMLKFSKYSYAKKVKEYNCAEKDEIILGAFYFDIDKKYHKLIFIISIVIIIAIIFGGIL